MGSVRAAGEDAMGSQGRVPLGFFRLTRALRDPVQSTSQGTWAAVPAHVPSLSLSQQAAPAEGWTGSFNTQIDTQSPHIPKAQP